MLNDEKTLRIYTLPLRQKIVREMSRLGCPATAKQIADRLQITPSSAQHHMKKLASIGLLEDDHTELINGIRANFMRLADVTVSIGQMYDDELSDSREAFVHNQLEEIYHNYLTVVQKYKNRNDVKISRLNDIATSVMHLTEEQADELHAILTEYLQNHTEATENTHPWEMAVMAYRMDLAETKE